MPSWHEVFRHLTTKTVLFAQYLRAVWEVAQTMQFLHREDKPPIVCPMEAPILKCHMFLNEEYFRAVDYRVKEKCHLNAYRVALLHVCAQAQLPQFTYDECTGCWSNIPPVVMEYIRTMSFMVF